MLKMLSNSLPDADLNLPEMKTKSPSCPSGGVHMYVFAQMCLFVNLGLCSKTDNSELRNQITALCLTWT